MTYLTDRLPRDIAISALGGCAGAVVGGLLVCAEATREFTVEYPHDGQNGLGGFYFGLLSTIFFGPLSAALVFAIRYQQYRKLRHAEEEKDFEAELLAARKLEDGTLSLVSLPEQQE